MIQMGDKKRTLMAIMGPPSESKKEPAAEAGHAIAEEMIECFHAKDAPGLWAALKAAFSELDSDPSDGDLAE